ncbi:MAG: Zn-ribbon domain-containing OB-fold protein [Thaumarchaeota archaeon]|nr:Zn-ribbon domain-containing OB-fold protein [Nitrososphaerota archaeon]
MSGEPTLHSRRTLTLRFDIPISKTREFWDALKEGKLVATKCTKCGTVSFPPQGDCPKCMGSEFTWFDLGSEAKLVTFTQVQITPASFVENDPYVIAIAEFPGGTKVLAWLEGVGPETAKLGMKLRVESRLPKEGSPYYVFVPA